MPAPPPVTWASSHATVPIAQELGSGRVRIWFSPRDVHGRSLVGWAELDLEAPSECRYSPQPLLEPGPRGAFDDAGVMAGCLVDRQDVLHLYYIGWSRRADIPFETFVGLARSDDGGASFRRVSQAPVLERGPHDPYLTTSPWVLVEEGRWRMWYASGTGWPVVGGRPRHEYRIVYAESEDGVHWERDGHVCIDYGPGEFALARPCVVRDDRVYRMWFCARGDAYRLQYAESRDGLAWERLDAPAPPPSVWDGEMQCYPFVFDHGGARHMLYNGNGYGATGIGHAVLEA